MFSALKKIFAKDSDSKDPNISFEQLKTDMHSHVLPGLDDGSESVEQSLEMIAKLMELGYQKLIMTPHIMGDFYKNTPTTINEKLTILQVALKQKNWQIELACAAEYYLDEWFLEKIEAEPLLTFGDNYVLFETSYINEPFNFKEAVFKLKAKGYKPVLAHPERYTYLYGRFEDLVQIYESGVLLQVNINAISGYYGPGAKRVAEKLIDQQIVHFLGTDAHHSRHLATTAKTQTLPYYKKALALPLLNNQL